MKLYKWPFEPYPHSHITVLHVECLQSIVAPYVYFYNEVMCNHMHKQ